MKQNVEIILEIEIKKKIPFTYALKNEILK